MSDEVRNRLIELARAEVFGSMERYLARTFALNLHARTSEVYGAWIACAEDGARVFRRQLSQPRERGFGEKERNENPRLREAWTRVHELERL